MSYLVPPAAALSSKHTAESANAASEVDISAGPVTFNSPTRGVYVGTAGDLVAIMASGVQITFKNLAAGVEHPLSLKGIQSLADGTTAQDIVVLY